jgi:REP element-mobilizing transposase RayT
MARPLRIEYPGAWYHVMNRGPNRNRIFSKEKDDDYELFIKVLKEACSLFNVYISAYCLMSNHYHIVVHTPEGNLSRFMRHVNGVYTQRYNRKHNRDGALFRGRYKAILIQAEEYLTQVVKYVHYNPLKAKIVNNLNNYKWSSHPAYLKGKNDSEWLDINNLLAYFSSSKKKAILMYKEFMNIGLDDEVMKFYSKKAQSSIFGAIGFVEMIKEKFVVKDKESTLEITEKRLILGEGKVKTINKMICNKFNIEENILFQTSRGEENMPRLFAISLSRELSGLSFPELAKRYKIKSYKTIASSNFRLKERMEKSRKIKMEYSTLKKLCSQGEI